MFLFIAACVTGIVALIGMFGFSCLKASALVSEQMDRMDEEVNPC